MISGGGASGVRRGIGSVVVTVLGVALEGARRWKVTQVGLIGEAVGEVVKVDRGEKVKRTGGALGVVWRGELGLLGKAEGWVCRHWARRGLICGRG